MSEAGERAFQFACPECYVSLKARPAQSGTRLRCPSCTTMILVPSAPQARSVAGKTDRILAPSAGEPAGEYGVQGSGGATSDPADLITVTCSVCGTRMSAPRASEGSHIRCPECGTALSVAETPKSLGQTQRPVKINQASVGEYGLSSPGQDSSATVQVTIPFHCRLCGTLLRGQLAEVGTNLACPDCGTKTVVPAYKKPPARAAVGESAAELGEYGLCQPNIAPGGEIPVVCALCSSRLMARPDQVGSKIRCPDCGTETPVKEPARHSTGAMMGAIAETARGTATAYGVGAAEASTAASLTTPGELLLVCPKCGRQAAVRPGPERRVEACRDCGAAIAVPQRASPPAGPAQPSHGSAVEKVVYVGVACPRCGTRIHATEGQVGQKLPCPDCGTPITIPPPKAGAVAEERVVESDEYAVGAPSAVVSQLPVLSRALPKDPANDPDFDFRAKPDRSEVRWQLPDRSDQLGFLGHPEATSRWLGYSLSGVVVFGILAVGFMVSKAMSVGGSEELAWFLVFASFAAGGLPCLAWAALFSVNLLAIVQDTSAGNRLVRNWPEGYWMDQIGESFFVLNALMVSAIPFSILLQTYPPARPWAMHLYVAGFWLTLPPVLLSMLEAGSFMAPLSTNVAASLYRCVAAWAWFYVRSLALIALTLGTYIAFWQHVCGPIALPILAPVGTALAMVYARWLGILASRVRETIQERAETEDVKAS
ncbi:MAG: hypothetical protein ACYC6Y_04660 [Thermoguttaceae bacterium]